MISAERNCRYNYKGDKNRVYQKVVAQIQMEPPGTPGVNEVFTDNPKHYPGSRVLLSNFLMNASLQVSEQTCRVLSSACLSYQIKL